MESTVLTELLLKIFCNFVLSRRPSTNAILSASTGASRLDVNNPYSAFKPFACGSKSKNWQTPSGVKELALTWLVRHVCGQVLQGFVAI
jgi:hypothetical protein